MSDAIHAMVTDADGMTTAQRLAEWREAAAKELAAGEAAAHAPLSDASSTAYTAAAADCRRLARLAWDRPLDHDGLRWRAEIVQHCLWIGYHWEPEGTRRFAAVLKEEPGTSGLDQLDGFDERAIAEQVRAVLWAPEAARPTPEPAPQRDWLEMLRDAGPNSAAPDARHAAIYAAQPEPPQAGTSAGAGDGRAGPPDIDDLVERARDGLATLRTLWNAHAVLPGGVLPEGSIAFAASIEFVIDSLEGVLDDIAKRAATNAGGDAGGEAKPQA
jgi:hypothetical protein